MEQMKPITQKQLAERFGVSLRTVARWMESGRISYIKIGHLVKFTEAAIVAFEKAHTVKAIV